MIGAIEFVKPLTGPRAGEAAYAIIRSEAGERFFCPPAEAPAGLARGHRVEFEPDAQSDPRGPVARRVRIVAPAAAPLPPETRLPDAVLRCETCKQSFGWSSAERAFYRTMNFDPPKRCKPCRRARADAQHGTA
jgi:hypothetical protein